VKAAVDLVDKGGLQAISQMKVARAAGVRQSHLTYYFPTRNLLLQAIVEELAKGVLTLLDPEARPADAFTLAHMRESLLQLVSDRRVPKLMVALIVAADQDPELNVWLDRFEDRRMKDLRRALESLGLHVSEEELFHFHVAMVGGLVVNIGQNTPESALRTRRAIEYAFDKMVAAATAHPTVNEK
jgi:AcrR family transcriptional regulator